MNTIEHMASESNASSIIYKSHINLRYFPCQLKHPNAFARVVLVGVSFDGEDGVVDDICDYAGMPLAAAMVDKKKVLALLTSQDILSIQISKMQT
jgi:hypothetical protein